MSYYTVFNLKQDVDSDLHSGGVSQLQNFYNTVDKGRRAMIGKVRPEELVRKSYLENALYPAVDRYAVPEDLKYKDIVELKLLSGYRNVDYQTQPLMLVYRRRFGQKRDSARNVINIGYENGVKYARILRPRGLTFGSSYDTQNQGEGEYVLIHNCDSLTENGTWNTGGNVVNLHEDKLTYVVGTGSLAFDINNSSTAGFIENFTLDTFDLSDFFQKGASFAWLDISIPKEMTSVKLIMGSDPTDLTTDLYTSTVNQPHDNNEFTTGWNLLKWMLNNLTIVGTPNPKALAYIRLEFTTTGEAIPNCHVDNIIARKGKVYEVVYNSAWCFLDAQSKAFKKIPTANSDIILAEEDTYQLLRLETTLAAQREIYGSGGAAKSDVQDVADQLSEAYRNYLMEHKSEAMLVEDSTYIFGNQYDGYTDVPLQDWFDDDSNTQTPNQP